MSYSWFTVQGIEAATLNRGLLQTGANLALLSLALAGSWVMSDQRGNPVCVSARSSTGRGNGEYLGPMG
jgi:hypothetical protein